MVIALDCGTFANLPTELSGWRQTPHGDVWCSALHATEMYPNVNDIFVDPNRGLETDRIHTVINTPDDQTTSRRTPGNTHCSECLLPSLSVRVSLVVTLSNLRCGSISDPRDEGGGIDSYSDDTHKTAKL